jgi:hypothetical protein
MSCVTPTIIVFGVHLHSLTYFVPKSTSASEISNALELEQQPVFIEKDPYKFKFSEFSSILLQARKLKNDSKNVLLERCTYKI